MDEYINREKLRQHLLDEIEACNDPDACASMVNYGFELGLKHALSFVNTLPAEDVVKVKCGKWQEHYAFGCWHYDCPFCDDGYATSGRDETPPNYCQNCGNKLEGVTNNAT